MTDIDGELRALADKVRLVTIETCARVAELEGNERIAKRIRALAGPGPSKASQDLDGALAVSRPNRGTP